MPRKKPVVPFLQIHCDHLIKSTCERHADSRFVWFLGEDLADITFAVKIVNNNLLLFKPGSSTFEKFHKPVLPGMTKLAMQLLHLGHPLPVTAFLQLHQEDHLHSFRVRDLSGLNLGYQDAIWSQVHYDLRGQDTQPALASSCLSLL